MQNYDWMKLIQMLSKKAHTVFHSSDMSLDFWDDIFVLCECRGAATGWIDPHCDMSASYHTNLGSWKNWALINYCSFSHDGFSSLNSSCCNLWRPFKCAKVSSVSKASNEHSFHTEVECRHFCCVVQMYYLAQIGDQQSLSCRVFLMNFVFSNSGGLVKTVCIYNKFAAQVGDYSSSK